MKRIVSLLVLLVLFLSMVPSAHAYEAPVTSANQDEHFYVNAQRWNDPITSTLEVTEDGYTRVEYVGDRLIAEKYDRNFRFISGQEIQLELSIYGGVYLGQDYNFVVVGQTNLEEDDTVEVFRIIRYSKDWVRQASASIYGANTTVPFDAGCLRFARSGDILYIRTAHEMYADENGINHQANVMISVRISDMTVTDQLTKVWNQSYGYVSHSFNQFVLVDGSTLLAVDHGDYYPRSVVLFKYRNPAGQETFYSRVSYVNALNIANSSYHYNDTGVSVGGFEASSDHYLIAGCSADQTEVVDLMEAHRNIFVTATPKDNFTDDATTIRWLTSFREEDNVEVSPPHLVKLSADRFFLIWTENGQLRYCTLDGKGEVEGEIRSVAGDLSDCVPVVDNGKVIWYVANFSAPKFYVIDPDATGPAHSYENGFCTECGAYEPAVLNGNVYEISNAGQLYWFAQLVNSGEYTANGKLTADITVNENVMNSDGTLGSGTFRAWTPMGKSQSRYEGTFDGNFKTVSGLYFGNGSMDCVGLFGCLGQNGLVKNLGILDTYFRGADYVGAIAGVNYGTVDSCYSSASLKGRNCVGGIAGSVDGSFDNNAGSGYGGTVKHCYSLSFVQGDAYVGGVAGYVMNTGSQLAGTGTVENCFFLCDRTEPGEVDGLPATRTEFASGEVAYYLGDAFGQTIGTDEIPVFGGQKVYRNQTGGCTDASFTYAYSNTAAAAVTTHDMTAATCQEAAHCTRCGITQGSPLGHNYETRVVDPTCTRGGYTETKCTRCGDGYVSNEVGPLGHDHVGTVTEPTCQAGGYTTYVCSRCGDSYVGDYTDPVDHVYEDGKCKWCDETKKDYSFSWYSGTTSLNGTIDLNIYALLSEDLRNAPNAFVRFSYAGKTVDVPMSEALHAPTDKYPNRYRFTCPMYAKEVVEDVTIRMMLGDEMLGKALDYGIVKYCMNQINKSQDEKQVALCKALLNYASAAQVTLNYKPETLANAAMKDGDKVLPENFDVSAYAMSKTGSQKGIKAKSATLMLESDVSVRVYFTLEAGYDIDDFTFTIDGKVVTPQYNEKGWYIETEGIAAKHLEEMHTFCVGGLTVKYGPMSYVLSKLSSTKAEDVNLAKAVYGYWQAAEALLG